MQIKMNWLNSSSVTIITIIDDNHDMLPDIECLAIKYITYTNDHLPYKFKNFKCGYYVFGYYGIFVGKHKIDTGFIIGLIDAKRMKFLDRRLRRYASEELMFHCQIRRHAKLIKRLIVECDIDPLPEWATNYNSIDVDFNTII